MSLTQTQRILERWELTYTQYTNLRRPLTQSSLLPKHKKFRRNQYPAGGQSPLLMDTACKYFCQGHGPLEAGKLAVIEIFGRDSPQYQEFVNVRKDENRRKSSRYAAERESEDNAIIAEHIDPALNEGRIPDDYVLKPLLFRRIRERICEPKVQSALHRYLFPYVQRLYDFRLTRDPILLVYELFGVSLSVPESRINEDIETHIDPNIITTFGLEITLQRYRNDLVRLLKEQLETQLSPLGETIRDVVRQIAYQSEDRHLIILNAMFSDNGSRMKILRSEFGISRSRGYEIRRDLVKLTRKARKTKREHNKLLRAMTRDILEELGELKLATLAGVA